jgi:hypothetical protein
MFPITRRAQVRHLQRWRAGLYRRFGSNRKTFSWPTQDPRRESWRRSARTRQPLRRDNPGSTHGGVRFGCVTRDWRVCTACVTRASRVRHACVTRALRRDLRAAKLSPNICVAHRVPDNELGAFTQYSAPSGPRPIPRSHQPLLDARPSQQGGSSSDNSLHEEKSSPKGDNFLSHSR